MKNMNYGSHGVMRSQNKEKRTKFRFFTSGDWISKEDLLKHIDSHLSKTIFFES
jgi:hypothetical protein